MPSAANASSAVTDRPSVKLRDDQYVLYTNVLGATTDAERARLFDLDVSTIYRARSGKLGEAFIAHTLAVLNRPEHLAILKKLGLTPDFDALFVVEASA